MKKKLLYLLIVIFISFKAISLEVTLTQGTIKPTPIAITDFFSNENKTKKIGKNISIVISDNLERSGLFLPIDKKSFIQNNESLSKQIRFEDWKIIKSQYLLSGSIQLIDSKILVSFKLYDILSQKVLEDLSRFGYNGTPKPKWLVKPINNDSEIIK